MGQRAPSKRVLMLDMIQLTENVADPIGSTAWMNDPACSGHGDLFFAPFAERPEARVRRETAARTNLQFLCVTHRVPRLRPDQPGTRVLGAARVSRRRAAAGFAPTTPIIGRKRVAEQRARDAMKNAS